MSEPWFSVVVPAHNEGRLIRETLRAIHAAAQSTGLPYEVIVVDDASTDRTAAIAAAQGARVVAADVRQIGAARNAGARAARGEMLVFVDADTIVPAAVLQAAIAQVRNGAIGGGASAVFDAATPRWAVTTIGVTTWFMRHMRWAAVASCSRVAMLSNASAASTSATSPRRRFT